MKDIYKYIIAGILLVVVGIFAGWKVALGLGVAGGGTEAFRKKNKKTKEKVKQEAEETDELREENDQKIEEAGDDIEAEHYDTADDAASDFNDVLDDDSTK